jgi:hypothetical protein
MFWTLLALFRFFHLLLPLQSCSGNWNIGDVIHDICNIRRQMWVSPKDFDSETNKVPRKVQKFPQW